MDVSELMSEYKKNGLEEILGRDAVEDFTQMMETEPTDPFVRGTLMRAGRAGFHYWLKQEGTTLEEVDADFRLSPVKKKIHTGLQHLCGMLSSQQRYNLEFKDNEKNWELALTTAGRTEVSALDCSFLSGFAQEFASWAGMGRLYHVRVITSEKVPVRCSILIEKEPVE